MDKSNANIDYCGIRSLLRLLIGQGFTEAELKKEKTVKNRIKRTHKEATTDNSHVPQVTVPEEMLPAKKKTTKK